MFYDKQALLSGVSTSNKRAIVYNLYVRKVSRLYLERVVGGQVTLVVSTGLSGTRTSVACQDRQLVLE